MNNIFLEKVNTADEAVAKLIIRGILTPDGDIDCKIVAEDIEDILCNEDLQRRLLSQKDRDTLKNTPASKKEQVLQKIREVGITSLNLGRVYLPRWDISKKDFERALEKKFS